MTAGVFFFGRIVRVMGSIMVVGRRCLVRLSQRHITSENKKTASAEALAAIYLSYPWSLEPRA